MPAVAILPALTESEARQLTDRIRSAAECLWGLLLVAQEREAWRALGYASFREYAKSEFDMGKSQAYRLVDHGRALRAIEAAAGSPVGEIAPERVTREIKPVLNVVTKDISDKVAAGEDPIAAVTASIKAARSTGKSAGQIALGPPANGLQFARIAIMKLEEVRPDDLEREEAFEQVRGWLEINAAEEEPEWDREVAILKVINDIRCGSARWPRAEPLDELIREIRNEADCLEQRQARRRAS